MWEHGWIIPILVYIGGMLSTVIGVAWGTRGWKAEVDNGIKQLGAEVEDLKKERHLPRPYCHINRKELLAQVRQDIREIVGKAIADEEIKRLREQQGQDESRHQSDISLAKVIQQNKDIIHQIKSLQDSRRDDSGGPWNRSGRVRASDAVNPVTGDLMT